MQLLQHMCMQPRMLVAPPALTCSWRTCTAACNEPHAPGCLPCGLHGFAVPTSVTVIVSAMPSLAGLLHAFSTAAKAASRSLSAAHSSHTPTEPSPQSRPCRS